MRSGEIFSKKEMVNFLMEKVSKPYAPAYINHLVRYNRDWMVPYAIVLDLHAFNFPAGRQTVNNSGFSLSAEAFFKIKTMTACPTQYKHNNKPIAPADRQACCMTNKYACKFKVINRVYIRDTVSNDGTGTGPFDAAQQQFSKGQVIPLRARQFGEVS